MAKQAKALRIDTGVDGLNDILGVSSVLDFD
jgi:hypothetical protein